MTGLFAVAFRGAGAHPAAWRWLSSENTFTADYWMKYVRIVDNSAFAFVTFLAHTDDSYADQLNPQYLHLDPALIAARVAPVTQSIGLIPQVDITHTEPFHTAKSIASLDYISHGRAGVDLITITSQLEENHYGLRPGLPYSTYEDLHEEIADYTQVLRELWDSWEDTAEIRDSATGRFIDRNKLHYINFSGRFFSVKGPLITPRPPQGQPLIFSTYLGASPDVYTTTDALGTHGKTFYDLEIYLDTDQYSGADRKSILDSYACSEIRKIFTGSVTELIEFSQELMCNKSYAGIRFFPGVISEDIPILATGFKDITYNESLAGSRSSSRSSEFSVPSHTYAPFDRSLRFRLGFSYPKNRFEQMSMSDNILYDK